MKAKNPILWTDMPDADVIRVDDTFYMISTTMHMMPGGIILRSYDLVNWEIISYVFSRLEENPWHYLEEDKNIYGKGMWAASLRYHKETFYVCFSANDTGKTYLYQSENIEGPWKAQEIDGFFHDNSLLFDEDSVYIVYGNKDIYLTELNADLTAPKENGIHKLIITDTDHVSLGYEGAHFYKINGKYYIFLIHWLAYGTKRRVQACFVADKVDGEYRGADVLNDDMGYHNAGVAQGGIVDTPDGSWYAMLFQDHGAVGRIPVLVPVKWEDNFPVFGVEGKAPHEVTVKSIRPEYRYRPVVESDSFQYSLGENGKINLKKVWQWNHNPKDKLWSVTEQKGCLRIHSGKISKAIVSASNILTQRTVGPRCEGIIQIDGSGLKEGDFTGIAAFQGCYGFIALTQEEGQYYLVMIGKDREVENISGQEYARIQVESPFVTLKASFNFIDNTDEAEFYYLQGTVWKKLGITQKLYFLLDHFMGCRIGLFLYSTQYMGGYADFKAFEYTVIS